MTLIWVALAAGALALAVIALIARSAYRHPPISGPSDNWLASNFDTEGWNPR